MSFESIEAWWWPFLFIALAGWLPTDVWRYLGVMIGGRVSEESDLLVLVRCIATALVAAVVSGLVVHPGGPLADTPLALRLTAMAIGFVAYLRIRRSVLVGIFAAELVLVLGMLAGL